MEYATVRIKSELLDRLKQYAKGQDRSAAWVLGHILESFFGDQQPTREAIVATPSTAPAVLERLPAPVPSGTLTVSVDARQLVQENVPRHLLSNTKTRTGLFEQAEQMQRDGCDPRGIVLALQEWTNRPDAYPGHLPHIYTELLRKRTATPPKSAMVTKMEGYREIGDEIRRRMADQEGTIEGEIL